MEDRIKSVREFTKNVLNRNISNISRDDYYIFLISRFLLLKEKIIKKESVEENDILHFNIVENWKYFEVIKYIIDYIDKHGIIVPSNNKVVIEPFTKDIKIIDIIKKYIRSFHLLRNIFAHGIYQIDFDHEQIIINDSKLKCSLPIEMLELFSFISDSQFHDKEEFKEYTKSKRSQYGLDFHLTNIYDNYYNYLLNDNLLNNKNLIYNNKYKFEKDNYKIIDYNKNNINEYFLSIKEQREKLIELINFLKSNKKLTRKEKELIYDYLVKSGIIDKKTLTLKETEENDKIYSRKIAEVIKQISLILNLKNNDDNIIDISVLYNYLQLLLSFHCLDFVNRKGEDLRKIGTLKFSKLNPNFNNLNKENYGSYINLISKNVNNFINYLNNSFHNYENHKTSELRNRINDETKKFYDETINLLAKKNISIIISIRNSLEHGNIEETLIENNCGIKLIDKSNQFNSNSEDFSCCGTPKDYFEIFEKLDLNEADNFDFNDLLDELKYILDETLYNKLVLSIEKLKKINIEAFINVSINSKNKL